MNVYMIQSDYFGDGYFGVYSTVKRARMALEHYFAEDENIIAFKNYGDYDYMITTADGVQRRIDIYSIALDAEFEDGTIKEDE